MRLQSPRDRRPRTRTFLRPLGRSGSHMHAFHCDIPGSNPTEFKSFFYVKCCLKKAIIKRKRGLLLLLAHIENHGTVLHKSLVLVNWQMAKWCSSRFIEWGWNCNLPKRQEHQIMSQCHKANWSWNSGFWLATTSQVTSFENQSALFQHSEAMLL